MKAANENKVATFLKDGHVEFIKACADVMLPGNRVPGIPATKRQASRWLMGKGIAYKTFKGRV
jgi:hypothetical protein